MAGIVNSIFNFSDRLQMESLNQRLKSTEVMNSNIANAETPGFRALGYDFEEQLQLIHDSNSTENLKTTNENHMIHPKVKLNAKVLPDVYVRPTESVGNDGNTVDVEQEMALLAKNQILYRSTVESLSRKIALIKYAINGGR